MNSSILSKIEAFMEEVKGQNPCEPEFVQAVREVAETVIPFQEENPKYKEANILQRIVEPERIIIFRVPWIDDRGIVQVNRGYRVQFNSAIGPYKGGLRFHPSVNMSVLKFLGFEQIFKNALTTLSLGGAKGGSEFDPKGKSDNEVMRFCQSFMTELHRHINKYTDIPAGDIGVGIREIGYLFGQYKRLENEFTGVLTGKEINWGGSFIRPEATGYGTVYFLMEMLKEENEDIEGKTAAISGSGNVAQFAAEKILDLGGKVLTFSDSSGYVYASDGFSAEQLDEIMELKNVTRGRIGEMAAKHSSVTFYKGKKPWDLPGTVDLVIPCATENELDENDAQKLIDKGARYVAEGANMPCTTGAVHLFQSKDILFAPGKAANAGGVATSGLEMAQNSSLISWPREKVDRMLLGIMKGIHSQCLKFGKTDPSKKVDYVKGANLAGFVKVADAMIDQGAV